MTTLKLKEEPPRKVLGEGRDYGVGMALAGVKDGEVTLAQPVSPCLDYLNDVLYTEVTGISYYAHGLQTSKKNIFTKEGGWIVVGICDYHSGSKYGNRDKEISYLDNNLDKCDELLRWFGEKFGAGQSKPAVKLKDNRFMFHLPPFWLDATYKISLWSKLMRIAIEGFYDGGEKLAFITSAKTSDNYSILKFMPKVEVMMNGKCPKQDMTKSFNVHNCGIVSFHFSNIKQEDERDEE